MEIRKILAELVDECSFYIIPDIEQRNNVYKDEVSLDDLRSLISKAKKLLNE